MKLSSLYVFAAALRISSTSMTGAFNPSDGYYFSGTSDIVSNNNATGILLHHNYTKILGDAQQEPRHNATGINHYTTIGMQNLAMNMQQEKLFETFKAILTDKLHCVHVDVSKSNDSDDCFYCLYSSKTGAQLWGEFQSGVFCGFVPHFEGKSRVKVFLLSKKERPHVSEDGQTRSTVLDGGFLAVPDDGNLVDFLLDKSNLVDGPEEGLVGLSLAQMAVQIDKGIVLAGLGFTDPSTRCAHIAFEFDCPDFGCFPQNIPLPASTTVQLSAFAREIMTFHSVEEYYDSLDGDDAFNFASQCFGAGNFLGDKDKSEDDLGYALIVGHVVETEKKTNELTGKEFYWALLRTACDVEIDAVIHPALLDAYGAEPPKVGGVIRGYFWLSGRLHLDEIGWFE